MEKLKSFLRKNPSLYRFLQDLYGKTRLIKERILKVNIDEKEEERWENRHVKEGDDWAADNYWDVRNHPATHFLLKKIEFFSPFSSILEIGCNCGPNLCLIGKKFPDIEARGIDINSRAVQRGNELLIQEGVLNVKLLVGRAYDLKQFSDKSFDIVFSKAVLCHIGPSKIKKVLEEMVRVAKRAIILAEYNELSDDQDDSANLGIRLGYDWRWKRNYVKLIKQIVPTAEIHLIKIPEEIWGGEDWGKMGYIIEVNLNK